MQRRLILTERISKGAQHCLKLEKELEVLAPYIIWTHSVEDIGRIACRRNDVKRVGIVGEVRRTRFGWVRWQSAAEVVCWAVVRTCRRLVSTGRIYWVAWNEVKVPLSVVERSVCASPVAVLVCATLP